MIPFTKMHGIGNDCVVIDARVEPYALDEDQIRLIADRRRGVGCDQLVLIEPPRNGHAAGFLRFYNSDGSEVEACGNATRCIVSRLMQEADTDEIAVETVAGLLPAHIDERGLVAVDMGAAQLDWRDIPLSREMDTLAPRSDGQVLFRALSRSGSATRIASSSSTDADEGRPGRIRAGGRARPAVPRKRPMSSSSVSILDRSANPHAGLGAGRRRHASLRLRRLRSRHRRRTPQT